MAFILFPLWLPNIWSSRIMKKKYLTFAILRKGQRPPDIVRAVSEASHESEQKVELCTLQHVNGEVLYILQALASTISLVYSGTHIFPNVAGCREFSLDKEINEKRRRGNISWQNRVIKNLELAKIYFLVLQVRDMRTG